MQGQRLNKISRILTLISTSQEAELLAAEMVPFSQPIAVLLVRVKLGSGYGRFCVNALPAQCTSILAVGDELGRYQAQI